MFKKRTVKKQGAGKRSIEPEDSDDGSAGVVALPPVAKRSKLQNGPSQKKPPSAANDEADKEQNEPESPGKERAAPESPEPERAEDAGPAKPTAGPKAPPKSIRVMTLTDFQPDVCKDFQKTGYCGYGDTCKFSHIREESVQRKPVEREWETVARKPKKVARKKLETLV